MSDFNRLTALTRRDLICGRPLSTTLVLHVLNQFYQLQTDPSLYKMLTLGEIESDGAKRNLSSEIKYARQFFQGFSMRIKVNATEHWNGSSLKISCCC